MAFFNCWSNSGNGGLFSWIPARYVLCAMCFLGFVCEYTIKVSISVIIVAMVHHDAHNANNSEPQSTGSSFTETDDVCPGTSDDDANSEGGEFYWDEALQGQVLSAPYYGAVAVQLLAGRLSEIYGPKYILAAGIGIPGILTLLSPVAARLHVGVFIALRVLLGVASCAVLPATHVLMAKWYSAKERTLLAAIIMAAIPVGTILGLSISGVLANWAGWPAVFYFFGGLSLLWIIPYLFLVYNTPEDHPRITYEEREAILNGLSLQKVREVNWPVPWIAILTSVPFWAHTIMGAVGYAWLGSTLLSELPTFLSNILHFNLQKSGIISALPFLFATFSGMFFGFLSQWVRGKGYVSHMMAYRIFNTISGVLSVIFLFIITLVGCDSSTIVLFLILGTMSLGGYAGGSLVNNLDLGSNFAGTTSGISGTISTAVAMVTPLVVGALTTGQQTLTQWHIVFYISITMMLVSYLIYMIFGSVEEQPWNKPPPGYAESQESETIDKKEEISSNV